MPRHVNRHAGVKKRADGSYLARVFHANQEFSKVFGTQTAALEWQSTLKNDLRRCPKDVRYERGEWEATIPSPAGPQSQRLPSLDALVRWISVNEAAISTGTWVDPALAKITLTEYVKTWKATKVGITGKTWAGYNSILKKHISRLGDRALVGIGPGDVRAWVSDMERDGVGPVAIRQAHRLLSQILQSALIDERIIRNPALGVQLPRARSREVSALTIDELKVLAQECGPQWELMILFVGVTGVRFGEVCALQVRDLNPLKSEILVSRAWSTDAAGRRLLGNTKSHLSRTIPVNPDFMRRLTAATEGRSPDAWVFPGVGGEALNDGWFRKKVFRPAVDRAKLTGFTFHGLRHTCASLLIQMGTPITTVSQILGHASTKMTLDVYGHFYEGDSALWADRLGAHFALGTGQERDEMSPNVRGGQSNAS